MDGTGGSQSSTRRPPERHLVSRLHPDRAGLGQAPLAWYPRRGPPDLEVGDARVARNTRNTQRSGERLHQAVSRLRQRATSNGHAITYTPIRL